MRSRICRLTGFVVATNPSEESALIVRSWRELGPVERLQATERARHGRGDRAAASLVGGSP